MLANRRMLPGLVTLALAACSPGSGANDASPNLDAAASEASAGGIVGTWGSAALSPTDPTDGITARDNAYTFNLDRSLSLVGSTTRSATASSYPGCTETDRASGTYQLTGTSSLALTLTAATQGRSGCAHATDNSAEAPLDGSVLAVAAMAFAAYDTYAINGNTLTISSSRDAGSVAYSTPTQTLTRR